MKLQYKIINGFVLGISHQYYIDLDEAEGETLEEKMKDPPKVPMVFVYIGPLQLIVTW